MSHPRLSTPCGVTCIPPLASAPTRSSQNVVSEITKHGKGGNVWMNSGFGHIHPLAEDSPRGTWGTAAGRIQDGLVSSKSAPHFVLPTCCWLALLLQIKLCLIFLLD